MAFKTTENDGKDDVVSFYWMEGIWSKSLRRKVKDWKIYEVK